MYIMHITYMDMQATYDMCLKTLDIEVIMSCPVV